MTRLSRLVRFAVPAVVVAVGGIAVGIATGAIPDGTTIHSCVNTTTPSQNVRIIDPAIAGTRGRCISG
jgi:hypothetical protein